MQQYFDFGSGFVLYSRAAWIGASFAHMNRPNISILNETSRLPMKTTITGGLRLSLYGGPRTLERVSYLTPIVYFSGSGTYDAA